MSGPSQGYLFGADAYGGTESPPLARRTDPATSRRAAERHQAAGKVHRHRAIALRLITESPGCTGYELWSQASDDDRAELETVHELYRRLADIKNAGQARHGPPRQCRVKGTPMVTWELVL